MVIVCDRDIQRNGLRVKFFGEETSLPIGAVSLALRTGAAIVPIFSVRKSSNRYAIYIEPPLRLVDMGNHSHSVRANLERLVAIMERYIRQYPEQWVVLEPIWRNQVAELTQHSMSIDPSSFDFAVVSNFTPQSQRNKSIRLEVILTRRSLPRLRSDSTNRQKVQS